MRATGLVLLVALGAAPVSGGATVTEGPLFVGLGLGVSRLQPDTTGSGYHIRNGSSLAGKLSLGYSLARDLGLQLYYADLGQVRLTHGGSIDYQDMGLNTTYYFLHPRTVYPDLRAFVRFGLGAMHNQTNLNYHRSNLWHLMHGAGVEYGLSNGYALRADVDMYDKDAHLYSLSAVWRFGGSAAVAEVAAPIVAIASVPDEPVEEAVPAPVAEPEPVAEPPAEPAPAETLVAEVADSDGDSILDPQDTCPDTAAGTRVDEHGCPLALDVVLEGVVFARDSAELIGDSPAILDQALAVLQRYPDLRVEIIGHTDSRGERGHNQRLSENRARAVRDYLIAKGIAAERLSAKGMGEDVPVADNDSAEGRAKNRRVVLHTLQ